MHFTLFPIFIKQVKSTNQLLRSISSRSVSPRSLPHHTAGSVVYPLYFWTSAAPPRLFEPNRASLCLVSSVTHLSNKTDVSADEFPRFLLL